MPRDDLVEFLRGTDLLAQVPDPALRAIAGQMQAVVLDPGAVLFEQGSPGDAAYLIVAGELAMVSAGVELLRRGPGSFVGEFSLIDDQPRATAGVAHTRLELLRWGRDAFLRTLSADPAMAQGILRELTRKLRGEVDQDVALLRERDRVLHDLARAREIQAGMLPRETFRLGPLEVAGHCAPAGAVGGDFYDVLDFGDRGAGAVILDVTGHGFYSGLFVAMAKSGLHTQARMDHSPAPMMQAMRRTLALSLERRMLMTCAYVLIEPVAGMLRYANAGHPHPLHWSAADGQVTALPVLDPILGAQDVGESEYRDVQAAWRPGDILVLYTDGVIEARPPGGEEFGRARLERALAAAAGADATQVRDGLLQAVRDHLAAAAPRDDLTLLVVRALAAPGGRA